MIDSLFSFSLTFFFLFLLLRTRLKFLAIDKPNERSLHSVVVPRTGGLAIMLGVLITWLFIGVSIEWLVLPLALVFISLVDDVQNLKARWRFLAQIIAAVIFLGLYGGGMPAWLWPTLLIAIVWATNLYNFMDGSDGLAGGMALFGFSTYAIAAYLSGHTDLAVLCSVIASANFAFLLFNFHPAKIFMGDSGSIPLGFLAATIGIWAWKNEIWPIWFPLLVFSPFIADASVTLFKRICRREKFWLAHKTHYYQRLVQLGWGHKKTAIIAYVLMLSVSICALLTLYYFPNLVLVVTMVWLLIYLVLMLYVDWLWRLQDTPNPQ